MSCAIWTGMGFYILVWKPNETTQKGIYFGLAVVSLVFAFVQTIVSQQKEISRLKSVPPEVELKVEDLVRHRSPSSSERWRYADIFVQVSALLRVPASIEVEYTLDLIKRGSTLRAEFVNDLREWQVIERAYFQHLGSAPQRYFYRAMPPLDANLSVTRKCDGWLHFRFDGLSDTEITGSRMRLNAVTRYGLVSIEQELVGTLMGPLVVLRKGSITQPE